MRRYDKQRLLQEHQEIVEEILDIYSSKVFVMLDLFIFTALLGLILTPIIQSIWILLIILFIFFILFLFLYHLLDFR